MLNQNTNGNFADPASIPPVKNIFIPFFDWNYPSYYAVYCTGNNTIAGEKNYVMGCIYIFQYLFYLAMYIPSLIVISRPALFKYTCYKLMFVIGIWDNVVGTVFTLGGGIFSIMGANYCDHNQLLIYVGHLAHVVWVVYCALCVILALNRCIEINSLKLNELLFSGNRVWLWTIPVFLYGAAFSTSSDLPAIYNSVYSVYFFKIDFREGAPTVRNWFCFFNSCWLIFSLTVLYTFLLLSLRSKAQNDVQIAKRISSIQKKVMLQSFCICFSLYMVAISYTIGMVFIIPKELAKFATIAVQMCSGFTAFVYLFINKTIRNGVKKMLLGRFGLNLSSDVGETKFISHLGTSNNAFRNTISKTQDKIKICTVKLC